MWIVYKPTRKNLLNGGGGVHMMGPMAFGGLQVTVGGFKRYKSWWSNWHCDIHSSVLLNGDASGFHVRFFWGVTLW